MDTADEVLAFLKSHQPLSQADELDAAVLAQLDEARRFCLRQPVPESIPYWLGVFGPGDGGGVYQLVEDLLAPFSVESIAEHLTGGLQSPHESVQYWCAQISATFPSARLLKPLSRVLAAGSRDTRDAAVTALESIGVEGAVAVLRDWLQNEPDAEIRAVIQEAVGGAE
jgi:hypothetical protein